MGFARGRLSSTLPPAHQAGVIDLTFSPDGRTLASTTGIHPGELYLWDVATGRSLGGVPPSDQYFYLSMFSADGKSVAALQPAPANHPHRTLVWDCAKPEACPMIPDGQRLRGMGLHSPWIGDIAGLLDDGSRTTGLRPVLEEPRPRGLAFTRDGTVCVIGKGDGTFQLRAAWCGLQFAVGRMTSGLGREFLFFRTANPKVDELADRLANSLGRDRARITGGSPESERPEDHLPCRILTRRSRSGPLARRAAGAFHRRSHHGARASSLPVRGLQPAFSPDVHARRSDVGFRGLGSSGPTLALEPPERSPRPAGPWAEGGLGGRVQPRRPHPGDGGRRRFHQALGPGFRKRAGRLRGHPSLVTSVAWSPDGATLASAEWDNALRLWDVASRKSKAVLQGHTGHLRIVAFSPDGRFVATGSDDHTVRLWDATAGRSLAQLTVHTEPVFAVAFSPDGRSLATGALDGRMLLWDLATLQSKQIASGPQVFRLAFTPDGETLVSSHATRRPRSWDLATGRARTPLLGHSGDVRDLAVSPDGLTLATAGKDQTVRVWDLTNGQELLCLAGHQAWVNGVAFSPDGRISPRWTTRVRSSLARRGSLKPSRRPPGKGTRIPPCPSITILPGVKVRTGWTRGARPMRLSLSWIGAIVLAVSVCWPTRSIAREAEQPTPSPTEANPAVPAAGHSVHGEAFNDGPRHTAYLMPGHGQGPLPRHDRQARGPGVHRPGGRAAPLVLLLRGRAVVPPGRADRPRLRHGLLGHGDGERQQRQAGQGVPQGGPEARAPRLDRREKLYLDALEALYKEAGNDKDRRQELPARARDDRPGVPRRPRRPRLAGDGHLAERRPGRHRQPPGGRHR